MNDIKSVIVIGAGVSGIAAATRLYENGIKDLIVLEAENRIGGRIHTLDFSDDAGYIEMGAQWVHGEDKNIVFELASSRDVLHDTNITFRNMQFIQSFNNYIDSNVSEPIFFKIMDLYYNFDVAELVRFQSCGEYYGHKFEEIVAKSDVQLSEDIKLQLLEWVHQFRNSYDGCDTWFGTSFASLTEYKECDGNHALSWKTGYKTILSILMEKSEKLSEGKFQDNILTGHEVCKIRQNDAYVSVECTNGSVFKAKHVVVTVSLGVLKEQYENLFEPSLPHDKIYVIKNLSIGTVNKIHLKFPHRWWPDDINGYSFLWDEKHKNEYKKKGLGWITDVFSFSCVDTSPLVLCGWVVGSSARIMEQADEQTVMTELTEVLRKFVGNKCNVPDPLGLYRSCWNSNSHFRGSYSFRSLLSEKADVRPIDLASPVTNNNNDPVILFAGEATHPHYFSTVHGALETGWREADRILAMKSWPVRKLWECLRKFKI